MTFSSLASLHLHLVYMFSDGRTEAEGLVLHFTSIYNIKSLGFECCWGHFLLLNWACPGLEHRIYEGRRKE